MPAVTELIRLMRKHQLTRPEAGQLLGVARPTISSWLAPEQSSSHRAMPENMMRLLKFECSERITPALPEVLAAKAKRRA